jgi:phage regulator Rha-like protein
MPNFITLAEAMVTMTSREIAELNGKEHDNVRRDVRAMAEALSLSFEEKVEPSGGGRPSVVYLLPKRETLILVSGYSVAMRAKIIDRWQELESGSAAVALPNFADPVAAARAWADAIEATQRVQVERDHAVSTKAQIGSRREATAMAKAASAVREVNRLKGELGRNQQHATIVAVEKASGQQYHWLPLRRWCADRGVQPASVPDPRYGEVKAWPADAWGEVFGVDLQELFPDQGR